MNFKTKDHLLKVEKTGKLTFVPKTVGRVNVYLDGFFYCYCTHETKDFFNNY